MCTSSHWCGEVQVTCVPAAESGAPVLTRDRQQLQGSSSPSLWFFTVRLHLDWRSPSIIEDNFSGYLWQPLKQGTIFSKEVYVATPLVHSYHHLS